MTEIINTTPHCVNVVDTEGKVIRTFEPSGISVRLSAKTVDAGELDGIRLSKTEYGNPEGLPEMANDVYYIVSAMVKNALPGRSDLLVPAEQVRDSEGRIIGCRSLGL